MGGPGLRFRPRSGGCLPVALLALVVAACPGQARRPTTPGDGPVGGPTTSDGSPGRDGPGAPDGPPRDASAAPGATLFPRTAPWYQDVSPAPLDPQSGAVITGLDAHGGCGSGSMRIDFSIEVLAADAGLAARPVTKTADFYHADCDSVPLPVTPA